MKAKIVIIYLMTRVIVEDNASDEDIISAARPKFIEKIQNDLWENLEEITDDTEVPYDFNLDN